MSLSIRHPTAPGAYLQRDDQRPSAIASLRTDIPGFVGIAERGPIGVAVAVESFRQFQAVFGSFIGGGFLAYSVRAFFENGGQRTRVVRVASDDPSLGALPAACAVPVAGGGAGWTIAASSPGVWGNAVSVSLVERTPAQCLVDQLRSTPTVAAVNSTAGFAANALVRLTQPGASTQTRVVAAIDPARSLIYWIDPDPSRRGGRQLAVTGFDPTQPLLVESLQYDLLVYYQGRLAAVSQGLALTPEDQAYCAVLLQPIDFAGGQLPPGALPLVTLLAPPLAPTDVPAPLAVVSDAILPLTGGQDGLAALTAADFIGDVMTGAFDAAGRPILRGLAALAVAGDIAMIAAPDILIRPEAPPVFLPQPAAIDPCPVCPPSAPPPAPFAPPIVGELPPIFADSAILAVQAAMIDQCETLADRVALLDPPWDTASDASVGVSPIQAWRNNFDSEFAGLYYPWLAAPDPLFPGGTRALPPSGHVAGLIAANDLAIGVHHAPANVDVAWAQSATIAIDLAVHGLLNTAGVNVIRGDSGRPLRVMGARTVSSDPTFRFINVRRLLCMVRGALDLSTRWAVFEPNNPHTRASLTATITRFLSQLWKQGALVGASAAAAFQVVCDDSNNPPTTEAMGELFVDIGLAPSTPFEFVLLRLGRSADSLDVQERGVLAAGVA
ncbi:MAG TPA: phage tail sheath C-terminal domain-containing protein [Caulobacteraceae bacterium]|jgi:hypothetical protein